MKDIYHVGEVFLYNNGTIARITESYGNINQIKIKLRCVRPVKGKHSNNIGSPYTYQRWTTMEKMIKDNPKRVGTEEILEAVFKNSNKVSFMKRLLHGNRE